MAVSKKSLKAKKPEKTKGVTQDVEVIIKVEGEVWDSLWVKRVKDKDFDELRDYVFEWGERFKK